MLSSLENRVYSYNFSTNYFLMDQELWRKIEAFDFDNPPSEYGFSIRLANENYWTLSFTDQAILEYKKFMYLAATSELMVSPSEIIDKVWHQHLVFSQSYQDFCLLLGKQIQHVPSTHNKEDFQKFKQAKERTIDYYEKEFGEQPGNIWKFKDMFDSLHLEKASYKLRSFLIVGILAFFILTIPAYFLLRPLYEIIDNPYFIIGLATMTVITFTFLEFYNKSKFTEIISQAHKQSFIYFLKPSELIYLNTGKLRDVIDATVNELVVNRIITVESNYSVSLDKLDATRSKQQLQVSACLSELGTTPYRFLQKKLATKPIFWNIGSSMDAFRKYFNKSKKFGTLFYINYSMLAILVLFSFTRIITGTMRDKPIILITLFTILLMVLMGVYLQSLTFRISKKTIPDLYKRNIIPFAPKENDFQWSYFLIGTSVLDSTFEPLVKANHKDGSWGDSSSSSCGSGCGSSCGSCGGCGGGD